MSLLAPSVSEDHGDAHDRVRDTKDAEVLRASLGRLNERYETALTLRYLSGLTHEQAAAAMGQSKGTFAVTLHRATAALRRILESQEASDR